MIDTAVAKALGPVVRGPLPAAVALSTGLASWQIVRPAHPECASGPLRWRTWRCWSRASRRSSRQRSIASSSSRPSWALPVRTANSPVVANSPVDTAQRCEARRRCYQALKCRCAGEPASSLGKAAAPEEVRPPQHGLFSNKMTLITSYCAAMRTHWHQMALITSESVLFRGDRGGRPVLRPSRGPSPRGRARPSC